MVGGLIIMEKEEFSTLVKGMKAVYSDPKFIPDKVAFKMWYELLKDLDYEMASISIQKYMMTNKFPPSISDIRDQYFNISNWEENELHEVSAWGMVLKAMRNSVYNSEYEFSKLPTVIQKTVGSANQLREWAIIDDTDGKTLTVLQSNFMRTFRAVKEREKEIGKLNPEVLKMISNNNQSKIEQTYQKRISISEEREKSEKDRAIFTERIDNMIKSVKEKLKYGQ